MIWSALTGRNSTPARTLKLSGANLCTMGGLGEQLSLRKRLRRSRRIYLRQMQPDATANTIELNIRRDPTIYDGQFSNNGWLQELPKPMTKLTWDNAILIGPKMAERLQIASKDVVELELNGKKVTGAIWIQAGHPDNSVTVFLGYGRKRAGRVGTRIRLRCLSPCAQAPRPGWPRLCRFARPETPTNWLRHRVSKHGHAGWRASAAGARNRAGGIPQRPHLRD